MGKSKKANGASKFDRVISGLIIVLIFVFVLFAAVCIYHSYLVQGLIILGCGIALIALRLLIRFSYNYQYDAKRSKQTHRPNKKFKAGSTLIRCNGAMWQWSKDDFIPASSSSENSYVVLGSNGIRFASDNYADGYSWDDVMLYGLDGDSVVVGMSDASRLVIKGITKLKAKALSEQLSKRAVKVLHFNFINE